MRALRCLLLVLFTAVPTLAWGAPKLVYLSGWGSVGTATGQFYNPEEVAVGRDGNIYVVESGACRVQVFTSSGQYVRSWGTRGAASGQMDNPSGIWVTPSGVVYVADTNNNRVQVFTQYGAYTGTIGSAGTGDGQLAHPEGVAVDGAGYVYVLDTDNYRVMKFSAAGAYVTKWGSNGTGNGQFNLPEGIAVDRNNYVYVADTRNHRMQQFSSAGTFIRKWGVQGVLDGQLYLPACVAVDSSGCVYVGDSGQLQQFSAGGTWNYTIARAMGTYAPGTLAWPYGLALTTNGNLYEVDGGAQRIQSFVRPAWITSAQDVRNDQGRTVRIAFHRSSADTMASPAATVQYEVYRRADALPAAGAAARPAPLPLRNVSREQMQLAGWDYVCEVPAHGESDYSLTATTLVDSSATGGIRWSVFVIRAASTNPLFFCDSPADSGYSVDNLPPAPPAPFTGAYLAGATHLHWGAGLDSDLWYYRLYRGGTFAFVPGPSNLIAATRDTGYVDAGAAGSYYKLSAVDVNGNESASTLLAPSGTTGVPDGVAAFALERPANPAAGGRLTLSFALPSAENATLEMLDVSGRIVARQDVGAMGAGRHTVTLGGGEALPAGIYFVRLTQGEHSAIARVTVLR
jgi:DNA-binding beta-propeller fold protein YncE